MVKKMIKRNAVNSGNDKINDGADELDNIMVEDVGGEIEEIIAEYGGSDIIFTAYKHCETTGEWERIGQYSHENFNSDFLADKYGGGKFKIKVSKGGKYYRQFTVKYAVPKNLPADAKPATDSSMDFMKIQMAQNQQMIQTLLSGIIETLKVRPEPKSNTIDELIKLNQLTGKSNPTELITQMLNMFKMGKEMGGEAVDSGAPIEDKFVSKIMDMLTNRRNPPQPEKAIEQNLNVTAGNEDKVKINRELVKEQVKGILPRLVYACKNGYTIDNVVSSLFLGMNDTAIGVFITVSDTDGTNYLFTEIPEMKLLSASEQKFIKDVIDNFLKQAKGSSGEGADNDKATIVES